MMTKKDTFDASANTLNMYGTFFNMVAKEVGMEKALKLHADVGGVWGEATGKALKEQLGDKKIGVTALNRVLKPMMKSFGFDAEVKKGPKSLTLSISKCPMYDGYKMAGLDHKTIEKMCSSMAKAEYDAINKYYPKLIGSVKFRESAGKPCIEEFIIARGRAK